MIVDVQRAFEPPPAFVDALRRYVQRFPCRIYTKSSILRDRCFAGF